MEVLRLFPLFRRFRVSVEAEEVPLPEAVRTLSYASELVLWKVRWLLPASKPEELEPVPMEGGEDMPIFLVPPVMEKAEVEFARDSIYGQISRASSRITRGRTPRVKDVAGSVAPSIVPCALRDALLALGPQEKDIPRPRWNFAAHLRGFWREVRRMSVGGSILMLSRFPQISKMHAILNFLALLELVKRRRVRARQRYPGADITFTTEGTRPETEVSAQ